MNRGIPTRRLLVDRFGYRAKTPRGGIHRYGHRRRVRRRVARRRCAGGIGACLGHRYSEMRRKSMTARLQRSAPKEPKIAECRSRDPSLDRGFGVVPGEFDEPGDGSERRSGTRSIDMSCRQELGHEKGKIGDGIRQRIDRYASIRDADILRRGAA